MSTRQIRSARSRRSSNPAARWTVCSSLLFVSACRIDRLELDESSSIEVQAGFEGQREPGTPPPLIHAHVELSEFAVTHFVALEIGVGVSSGQGLEGQGLSLQWLGEAIAQEPVRARFAGPLSNTLELGSVLSALSCDAVPCRLTLELLPEGEWSSDVSFPIQYGVSAELALERSGRLAFAGDVALILERVP